MASKNWRPVGVINAQHINTLQGLCTLTRATAKDITDTFDELRRTLSTGVSKPSASVSRHGSKGRRGRSELRGGDGEGFDRPCTWKPRETRCWLVSQLEPWNRVLSGSCIKLREQAWGEMMLQSSKWPACSTPETKDVLRASLLVHMLLRQHRCVTTVLMQHTITSLEMEIFWHALKNGGAGVLLLEFVGALCVQSAANRSSDMVMWSRSAVCLPALRYLHLSYILFDEDMALTLGGYLVQTTTVKSIAFRYLQVKDEDAAKFLGYLPDNKTVTTLILQEQFVMARQGEALAHVLRNHGSIESMEINGCHECTPSTVLRAALQSGSLKSLTVRSFAISAEDIEGMAAALMRHQHSLASVTSAGVGQPPTPKSCLESLAFSGCAGSEPRLQRAYADLIGGSLLQLNINGCNLSRYFARSAAGRLLRDSRLRVLDITSNQIHALSLCNLAQALTINSTLEKMVFDLSCRPPQFGVDTLFNIMEMIGVSSRLRVDWHLPRPLDVAQGEGLFRISRLFVDLENCSAEDAATLLAPLASSSNITTASIECSTHAENGVVQQLVKALAKSKSVRKLYLTLAWPESSIVSVLRSLEQNRSVSLMRISGTIFRKRSSKALARLVEQNTMLNWILVDILEEDGSGLPQLRTILRDLKDAVPRNRFLTKLAVNLQDGNHATDFVILEALRRNRVFANEAVRFVKGSNDKREAFAFETLQHSLALLIGFSMWEDQQDAERGEECAKEQIHAARRRLAVKYFIFTGVVKTKIVCRPHPKGKPSLDKLGTDVLAHICSYLSLTDVMDI